MQKNTRTHRVNKALGLLCALVLLVCALYVPVIVGAAADIKALPLVEDTPFLIDFENTVESDAENAAEANSTGIGYYGWGPKVYSYTGETPNKVLRLYKNDASKAAATIGGYRLHTKQEDNTYGFVKLEPDSAYLVSFKIRVLSSPTSVSGSQKTDTAVLCVGYNSSYDSNMSGNVGNYVNVMGAKTTVMKSVIDSNKFTVHDLRKEQTYTCGEDWINVNCVINTKSFSADPVLAIWGEAFHGINCEIDDLKVTKMANGSNVVIFHDSYTNSQDYAFGKIGEDITLPDISDRAQQASHIFEGWYTDAECTVKAESPKFVQGSLKLYARWKSPVTITFVNTLDNSKQTVTGMTGTKIEYPADPVDPEDNSWFMGWYTDENYVTEFTDTEFGYSNITLYSMYKGKIPGISEDFENYNKNEYTVETNTTTGQKYKSNQLYFGPTLSKQSEVTYNDSDYALKFHWNPVAIDDKNNENYYDVSRYKAKDSYFWLGNTLENNQRYVVSLKYYAEKTNSPVNFYAISSSSQDNSWGTGRKEYPQLSNVVLENDGKWHEVSFEITTDFVSGGKYMYVGISLNENEETIVYFDDVKIEAFAQPYESVVSFYTNIDGKVITVKGKRGEEIDVPVLTHPNESKFAGWYLDEKFAVRAEEFVYPRGNVNLYAKWLSYSGFVQDFENYTQDKWSPVTTQKTNNMGTPDNTSDDITYPVVYKNNRDYFWTTISKQSDVVSGGDYALKFEWDTDPSTDKDTTKPDGKNINNPESYEHSRYKSEDNYFYLGSNIEDNQIYNITFKYKIEKGNQPVTLYLVTSAEANNVWSHRVRYNLETITLKPGGWQEASYDFTTKMGRPIGFLFFGVNLSEHKDVVMYFDDFKVKAYTNSEEVIMFLDTGYQVEQLKHIGTKGEKMDLPELKHPEGAEFLGWYANASFTTPYTAEVYPNANTILYAKWGNYTMTFINYPYEGHTYYDPYINRETAKGLGNGDDHAMRWYIDSDWDTSTVAESKAMLIKTGIEADSVYRVKFDYKVQSGQNIKASVAVMAGDVSNVWWTDFNLTYTSTNIVLPAGGTNGWETVEFIIKSNVLDQGWRKRDDLFLYFSGIADAVGKEIDTLIDNLLVEKVEAPFIYLDYQFGGLGSMVKGKDGEKVVITEKPQRVGYDFAGWYNEPECLTKFELETFAADTATFAYAKWTPSNKYTYSFENYTLTNSDAIRDASPVKKNAKSGKYSMYFGNRTPGNYQSPSYFGFEDGGEYFQLEYDSQYQITFNYFVKEYGNTNMNVTFIASWEGNIWNGLNTGRAQLSPSQPITTTEAKINKGKWATKTFAIDTNDLEDLSGHPLDRLYAHVSNGENWEIYFDDITITKVPKGKSIVVFDTMGAKGVPQYVIGKPGTSFSAKLPETLENSGLVFKGYYTMSSGGSWVALKREEMKFGEKATIVFARFIEREIIENFDDGFKDKAYNLGVGYSIHDFDYEVYDSEIEGGSKDNVTSGRYSLHRKGNSMFNENSVILTLGKQLSEGDRYTVNFKVKMGKHFHTDGAIKLVSGRSYQYAWTTTGSYNPVVAIADLADGQWHEVSYTFNSAEAFLVLQTPGYVELFMDDFKFTLVDKNTPVSEPITYTEYVPAERDADGNLIRYDRTAVDISTIIDNSLNSTSIPWLWIIIGAAAVLVIAGGVTAFIIIVKKKSKKA